MRLLFILILSILTCPLLSQNGPEHVSMRKIRSIQLLTPESKSTRIPSGDKPIVFVFLSPDCPLCKNYAPVLNKLYEDFRSQVEFIGIIPGKAYGNEEISRYQAKYKTAFNLVVDPDKKLTTVLHATITPEVLLLDGTGNVVYRGAIDDWVVTLGKKKLRPTTEYLRTALQQFLYHQPVLVQRTKPKGCIINDL